MSSVNEDKKLRQWVGWPGNDSFWDLSPSLVEIQEIYFTLLCFPILLIGLVLGLGSDLCHFISAYFKAV